MKTTRPLLGMYLLNGICSEKPNLPPDICSLLHKLGPPTFIGLISWWCKTLVCIIFIAEEAFCQSSHSVFCSYVSNYFHWAVALSSNSLYIKWLYHVGPVTSSHIFQPQYFCAIAINCSRKCKQNFFSFLVYHFDIAHIVLTILFCSNNVRSPCN